MSVLYFFTNCPK